MARPKRQKIETLHEDLTSRSLDEPGGVAGILRSARVRAGIDLYAAADKLCIRYRFLEAIEQGHFDELPGPTYALGFVRTYAELLGLDSKEIVHQFKEEGQGLSRRQALVFPEPLQEARFPSSRALIMAVVLAGAVYGGWSYWQHRQANRAETVAPVPPNLTALDQSQPRSVSEGATETPSSLSTASGTTSPSAEASVPSGDMGAKSIAAGDATAGASPTGERADSAGPSAAAIPPALENPAETGTAQSEAKPGMDSGGTVPPATAPVSASAPPSNPTNPTETAAAAGAKSAVPAAPVEAPAAAVSNPAALASEQVASKPNAQIYGETSGNSRVTLSATQDSWLQVRDKNGIVIWTRILRAGESYRVPNERGLTLVTGNAGALKVVVDGKAAPSLGPSGAVRRNVSLDPDKLAAGVAVEQ